MKSLSWWDYLRTQPEIICHYVRLSVWPTDLCFDYGWDVQANAAIYWPLVLLFCVFLLIGCVLWWKRSVYGFLVLAFFVYLAPSSSIIPIKDLAVEHRMYLPLVLVIAFIVLSAVQLVSMLLRLGNPSAAITRPIALVLAMTVFLVAGAYGWLTHLRTNVYQSPLLLWQDTVAKRPSNKRAKLALGTLLVLFENDPEAALPLLEDGITSYSTRPLAWHHLAECQRKLGMLEKAKISAGRAVSLDPEMGQAHNLLGIIHLQSNDLAEAKTSFERAVEFGQPIGRYNLATISLREGDPASALEHLESLIAELPDFRNSYRRLAWVLATVPDESLRDGLRALRILRDDFRVESSQDGYAWDAYAAALAESGEFEQAKLAAERGLALAKQAGLDRLGDQIAKRVKIYDGQSVYRDNGSDQEGIVGLEP
ncbi:MAG: tetratricopeptide repeat protein [Planctomycetota bacterium]